MIEFNGMLTGASKSFLLKKQMKLNGITALFITIVFSILIISIALIVNKMILLFLITILVFDIGILLPSSKNSQKLFMPKRIFLDLEEGTIVHQCEKMERFHMIDSVKKVVDYGEWYDFVFYYSDRDLYFVCQKSLLTKGTLEEFEALFEGKIVRKK